MVFALLSEAHAAFDPTTGLCFPFKQLTGGQVYFCLQKFRCKFSATETALSVAVSVKAYKQPDTTHSSLIVGLTGVLIHQVDENLMRKAQLLQ